MQKQQQGGSQICWSELENHPPIMNHKSDILPNKLTTHLIHVAEEIQLQSIKRETNTGLPTHLFALTEKCLQFLHNWILCCICGCLWFNWWRGVWVEMHVYIKQSTSASAQLMFEQQAHLTHVWFALWDNEFNHDRAQLPSLVTSLRLFRSVIKQALTWLLDTTHHLSFLRLCNLTSIWVY
jgi:hypothetical protein